MHRKLPSSCSVTHVNVDVEAYHFNGRLKIFAFCDYALCDLSD